MGWYHGTIRQQKGNILAFDGIRAPFFGWTQP